MGDEIKKDRKQHPSKQPIRYREIKYRPILRIPESGYILPRLKDQPLKDAIGFIVHQQDRDDES